ncbi:Asp23/Gls24 family envelope stress response protein [Tichowtungia aerotolerans]|uniref:Asp23/Gls24 family envelope stress response protein n=1 Tax=Tichowtungia aerotolerans TaxID=2697043 RepID=A0A6P1M326_9BACT|nr:Asp23/Gls24 family envelope stress response protein [Tichowtungia aerotolerans]QHI68231.1 Asp23/Gls24 family envelope stress response protein [Tichowtungia aerotolerans]
MSDKENKTTLPPGQNYPVPEAKQDDAGLGSVRIHNNVISVIAHEAADRVPGVVELSGTLVDGLADIIGKKPRDRGIRVAVESENTITVELTVVLEYGVNIPETCGKLQAEVRQAVEDMTGKVVQAVNVSVQGLRRTEAGTAEG